MHILNIKSNSNLLIAENEGCEEPTRIYEPLDTVSKKEWFCIIVFKPSKKSLCSCNSVNSEFFVTESLFRIVKIFIIIVVVFIVIVVVIILSVSSSPVVPKLKQNRAYCVTPSVQRILIAKNVFYVLQILQLKHFSVMKNSWE